MGITQSNLNYLLLFVYNILPTSEKINFISDINDLGVDEDEGSKLFNKYINKTELSTLNVDEEINFMFYQTPKSEIVDICVNGNNMHLNSDLLSPLKETVFDFASSGLILFRNNSKKKNKNIFRKRFYRCYTIINISNDIFPIEKN